MRAQFAGWKLIAVYRNSRLKACCAQRNTRFCAAQPFSRQAENLLGSADRRKQEIFLATVFIIAVVEKNNIGV